MDRIHPHSPQRHPFREGHVKQVIRRSVPRESPEIRSQKPIAMDLIFLKYFMFLWYFTIVKHIGKNKGIISRACSKCGDDLGDRYKSHRYCLACHAANMRMTRKRHWQLSTIERQKANCRAYANVYQRRGRIQHEPCVLCGNEKSQKHHPDYTRPLLIVWLCRPCHLKVHKEGISLQNLIIKQ